MVSGHKLRGDGKLMKKLAGQRKRHLFFIMICEMNNIEIFIFNYIIACIITLKKGDDHVRIASNKMLPKE